MINPVQSDKPPLLLTHADHQKSFKQHLLSELLCFHVQSVFLSEAFPSAFKLYSFFIFIFIHLDPYVMLLKTVMVPTW